MDLDSLFALVTAHKWLAIATIVIAFVVRLLKSDTTIPIDVPPRVRVWLALGLGILAGILNKVANEGTPWRDALLWGLSAAVAAIVGHVTVIDSLRAGREFVIPGLTKPGVPPGPGKPPSIRPPPMGDSDTDPPGVAKTPPTMMRVGWTIAAAALIAACGFFKEPNNVQKVVDFSECVATHAIQKAPLAQTIEDCGGDTAEVIAALVTAGEPIASSPTAIEARRVKLALSRDVRDGGPERNP